MGIVRWGLFCVLVALGVLELYQAAFTSWVSWGPPTDYPKAWAQRALLHFGYSVSLLATATMALIGVRQGFAWRSSKIKYLWIGVLVLGLGYPRIKEQILIDKCLDSGGAWSNEHFDCKR